MLSSVKMLYQGDPWRKSRFHDTKGNFIGTASFLFDVPRTIFDAGVRRVTGRRPILPWIPYPAIRAIRKLAKPSWRVLEHGSGMSTIWWSYLVDHVDSVEADRQWHARICKLLEERGRTNVSLSLKSNSSYSDMSPFADASFDFIVIDGHDREKVAAQSRRILKRPGWIYLDDSDRSAQWREMYGEAEEILVDLVQREGGQITYFTGFTPATFIARQGMLVYLPSGT
jgi:SAM-dependent methyltransferase